MSFSNKEYLGTHEVDADRLELVDGHLVFYVDDQLKLCVCPGHWSVVSLKSQVSLNQSP